jgi:class 3 adenylate cyclase/tetratricopeptide (TPR) repeat protein
VTCPSCSAENRAEAKFCSECGSSLARTCPNGHPVPPEARFCDECGAAIETGAGPSAATITQQSQPQAERRLVSILFADLVGHTSFSEGRDAEDVRELLSSYFETARTVIERYGGTVEKFIGDAVMAVWGAPFTQEDDAERAVRAALDLVDAVEALGAEAAVPGLRARAGVLTGEAAVTLGAEGQGMVAGDLVNTASRIQSAAEPGNVLVGETTRRASEAAIVFEEAGIHTLKGKTEPVQLWRAVRVVGLVGGALKATGIEPPFVGRDRELRLVKELYHASAGDHRAHLVSVVGIGGIGKSRLGWEFEKYIDGLAGDVWWHSGRCLAYGDGVAFWALGEMVRGRAGILEDEDATSARSKLRMAVEEHVPDPEERRFVEPRLAHLLGLEESPLGDQENLFAAARMFFERLAETGPAVLLFEDIHWADSALLDFIEYLIEWSRDAPLFVLTLARPELADRRPTWGSVKRNFTSIFLEPLSSESMEVLLTGPVPGLSEELRERILARAEGVPFYAVETVRMLLDRGILVREDNTYRLAGEIETLEVPETLQALISARLDGLAADERRAVQQASVLGRTFTSKGLAAVSRLSEQELEPILSSLVRKEVFSLTSDPLSPERGQFGFLQDLVKKVAYDTLSRRERKTLHLAAAAHLRSLGDEDELVEVLAAHYIDAYGAEPEDPDADEIRTTARTMLVRASERAASLAANAEALAHLEAAIGLTDDPVLQAELLERAGMVAMHGGKPDAAKAHFDNAMALFEQQGRMHAAARVSARVGFTLWDSGRVEDAVELMDRAFEIVSQEEPDADLAELAAELGRVMYFAGQTETAGDRIETALDIAESLWLPEVLSQALNTKSLTLLSRGRPQECVALLEYALKIALENDIPSASLRAYFNLAELSLQYDRFEEGREYVERGLTLARKVGNAFWERRMLGQNYPLYALGEWDVVLDRIDQLPLDLLQEERGSYAPFLLVGPLVHLHRGDPAAARRLFDAFSAVGISADVQERAQHAAGLAALLHAEGAYEQGLAAAEEALAHREDLGAGSEPFREGFVAAAASALALGDRERALSLVETIDRIPRGKVPQYLHAHAARVRAQVAASEGDAEAAEAGFKRSSSTFRELGTPFWIGASLLEYAEWLSAEARAAEADPLLVEAREMFERLGATPWLERSERVGGVRAEVPA